MRYLLILIGVFSFSLDLSTKSLGYLFKNNYYTYICKNRWKYINKYLKKREDLLSIVAYSCLKKRYITYALDLAKNMRYTPLGRNNSNYIATLFNIKTILRRYLLDKISLEGINLPYVTDNRLGRVFFLIKKENPKINSDNSIMLKDGKNNIRVSYNLDTDEIILEIFKDNILVKKEKYW